MALNRNANSVFYILMLAVVFFVLGIALAAPTSETVQEARINADCTNSSIDSFQKGGCILMDLYSPYLVGVIFALAGALLGGVLP